MSKISKAFKKAGHETAKEIGEVALGVVENLQVKQAAINSAIATL